MSLRDYDDAQLQARHSPYSYPRILICLARVAQGTTRSFHRTFSLTCLSSRDRATHVFLSPFRLQMWQASFLESSQCERGGGSDTEEGDSAREPMSCAPSPPAYS